MPPATDWQEIIPADEAARFERYAAIIGDLQVRRAKGRPPVRALHAKANVGLRAEFTVADGLPECARVGIFAQPQTLPALVRLSNGAGKRQSDAKPDLRGFAFKIVGVPGKKLIPGMEDCKTQDFLMIRQPCLAFRSVDEFMVVVQNADSPGRLLAKMVAHFGLARTLQLLPKLAKSMGEPLFSPAETAYYTAAPLKWGDYAAHCSLQPRLARTQPVDKSDAEAFRTDMGRRLAQGPVEFDFTAQFYVDAKATPIEDPSVLWPVEHSPRVKVATLKLLPVDLQSPAAQETEKLVETLSFDPWHAPVEFRPLGNVMRARNAAYRASTQGRAAAGEPDHV